MENLHIISENFKKLVQHYAPGQLGGELCQVINVEESDATVTCVGQSTGTVYYDVPLLPEPGAVTVPIPSLNSFLFVLQLDRLNVAITMAGKVDKYYVTSPLVVTQADTFHVADADQNYSFQLTSDGMALKKGGNDFKTSLQNLKTALNAMTFNTPAGPTSIAINITDINDAIDGMIGCLNTE